MLNSFNLTKLMNAKSFSLIFQYMFKEKLTDEVRLQVSADDFVISIVTLCHDRRNVATVHSLSTLSIQDLFTAVHLFWQIKLQYNIKYLSILNQPQISALHKWRTWMFHNCMTPVKTCLCLRCVIGCYSIGFRLAINSGYLAFTILVNTG